ncbi:AI-2E family transporter [uncultured Clostridium sp.]|uniref:AI-2E family transporter n=1 Tax=uncultured Clostridium sp. TaxID=59620 RepID=UPI00262D7EB7|nr:AI-2E family transporter [uncultured Clostridium sp.]
MKIKNLKENYFLYIGIVLVLLVFVLFKLSDIHRYIDSFMSMMSPIIVAIALAFIINLLVKFLENKIVYRFLIKKENTKLKGVVRGITILISIVIIFGIISTVIFVVVPKIVSSLLQIVSLAPKYLSSFEDTLEKTFHISNKSAMFNEIYKELFSAWKNILSVATGMITTGLSTVFSFTVSFASGIIDFIMSLILAIYFLFSKELLIRQGKKVIYALLSKKAGDKTLHVARVLNNSFAAFITGQCTEAFIIAVLAFILMVILRIPYALLIACLLGVTGVIPILGAFIGTIPAVLLLLMISPVKAITFVIAIVLLQQVESNVIYPRVVGSSVGLTSIWIMIAIIIGSYFYGVLGILIGIPLASAIYKLSSDYINVRIKSKELNI